MWVRESGNRRFDEPLTGQLALQNFMPASRGIEGREHRMGDGVPSDLEQAASGEFGHFCFGHGQVVRVRRRCVEENA